MIIHSKFLKTILEDKHEHWQPNNFFVCIGNHEYKNIFSREGKVNGCTFLTEQQAAGRRRVKQLLLIYLYLQGLWLLFIKKLEDFCLSG